MNNVRDYFTHRPHATKRTFIALGCIGVLFALFSFFSLFSQVHQDYDQVSGRVLAIMPDHIIIEDVRGNTTTLRISPETQYGKHHQSPDEIVIGSVVHSFGEWTDEHTFMSADIRIVRTPR